MTNILQRIKGEAASLRNLVYYRLTFNRSSERSALERFHKLYFDSHIFGKTWMASSWMGIPVRKCPMDLWTYQELIYDLRPDVIVETGTSLGGSAYYFASLCDLIDVGRVITIDIHGVNESLSQEKGCVPKARPAHPRITYLRGSSISQDTIGQVKALIQRDEKVMVILDSDHTKTHVLEELRTYAPIVSIGSYLIVEDTNINGHPVLPEFGPGPREALQDFLRENDQFTVDCSREAHLLTFNQNGYLRRIR